MRDLFSVVVGSEYGSVTNTAYQVVVNPANTSIGLFAGVIIQGTVGYSYNIQSTTNLSDPNSWVTVTNITLMRQSKFGMTTAAMFTIQPTRRSFTRSCRASKSAGLLDDMRPQAPHPSTGLMLFHGWHHLHLILCEAKPTGLTAN